MSTKELSEIYYRPIHLWNGIKAIKELVKVN